VAREKPTIQASNSAALASIAVDGNFSTAASTIACTLAPVHSWWAVDLVERFLVKEVTITTDDNVPMGNLLFYTFNVMLVD